MTILSLLAPPHHECVILSEARSAESKDPERLKLTHELRTVSTKELRASA
jgi:hypothetical protein